MQSQQHLPLHFISRYLYISLATWSTEMQIQTRHVEPSLNKVKVDITVKAPPTIYQ